MDTLLYDLSIPAISKLQDQFEEQAPFMQLMSIVFDPKYAFLIYSPIAYLVDKRVGKKLILTTVIAEWLNQVLKWFLHGERPYWYVHSSGKFDPSQTPIRQFPVTCELGPGHPSGHAMLTAAVWYIIINSILEAYNSHETSAVEAGATSKPEGMIVCQETPQLVRSPRLRVSLSLWSAYALLLVTISVSRVYLGCHFPHQCLAGAALGLALAKWISSLDTRALHFIGASAFMFATAFGTFGILQLLGLDPSWTIKLATKHCEKREYIHMDTAPFFSVMRYCGFALGAGLGLLVPLRSYAKQLVPSEGQQLLGSPGSDKDAMNPLSSRNISWFSLKVAMAFIMARSVDNLGLFVSHANLPLFYTCAFIAYSLFSFAFVNL